MKAAERESLSVLANTVLTAVATGMMLAMMTSFGIVHERIFGWSASRAITTSAIVTFTAIIAFVLTCRPLLTHFDESFGRMFRHRASIVLGSQTAGAIAGVLLVHAMLRASVWAALPGLYEHAPQLVNDFVATFGVLAIVWGLAQRPTGGFAIAGGVAVVLAYRVTASSWHFDHLAVASASATTIQQFVFAEWVAAALGLALFRALVSTGERIK